MLRSLLLMLILVAPLAFIAPTAAQPDGPPIAIDLTVSLEWEPGELTLAEILPADCASRSNTAYSEDLRQGLRAAAAYLYSYTRGTITLGNVQIFSGGAQWEQADIRVLASSGYRPSAFVGGSVATPTLREVTPGRAVIYYPGPTLLGRLWDGNPERRGARCGPWSSPSGWRTIGHELAHQVLFLYDQYATLEGAPRRCSFTGLARNVRPNLLGGADTLMSYHYSADELLLTSPAGNPACAGTAHEHIYADRSEWQALRTVFPSLPETPPPPPGSDLPELLGEIDRLGLADVQFATAPPDRDTTAPLVLTAPAPAPATPVYAEVYLVERDPNNGLQQIIGQGWALPGESIAPPLLGIAPQNASRAVAFVEDVSGGMRYASPPSDSGAGIEPATAAVNLGLSASTWRPQIRIIPELRPTLVLSQDVRATEVAALRVELQDCNRMTKNVEFTYCPAGGRCSGPALVTADGDNILRYTFYFPLTNGAAPAASVRGYIHARETSRGEEAVVWYQIGGGVGPAHGDAHAPLVDGLLNTDLAPATPGPARDSRLLHSPTAVCTQLPVTSGVTILGSPFNVEPVVATEQQSRSWGSDPADPPLSIRMGYTPDLLARLGVNEEDLVLLRLNADNPQFPPFWELVSPLQLAGHDRELDWLALNAIPFRGAGAIVALGYRNTHRLGLPLLAQP
ncbi:MAG: hypothetical protein HC822_00715 [Oscillochloris sp.]|nr:hypothetical protein [Oscillochloris sp.]